MYKRVVIKIGSQILTQPDGRLDTTRMSSLVDQIARLHREGMEVIVVSSGAVASGRGEVALRGNVNGGNRRQARLDAVSERQLFSAVGQVKLMTRYYNLFHDHGLVCGQVLTTRESLSTRRDYLNQRNCIEAMLAAGVVPVINENDAISVAELMFTDNDELSGMVATMLAAGVLVILSNIDGIYDGDPHDPSSRVIREVAPGHTRLSQYITASKSQFGRGGMLTKSRIASRVASEGVEVVIASGVRDGILISLLLERADTICTRFVPHPEGASRIKRWVAHSDVFARGGVHINEGAYRALTGSKASSLLHVGVERIEGEFDNGDPVRIFAPGGIYIGIGKVSVASVRARELAGQKGHRPLVHYDHLFIEPESGGR